MLLGLSVIHGILLVRNCLCFFISSLTISFWNLRISSFAWSRLNFKGLPFITKLISCFFHGPFYALKNSCIHHSNSFLHLFNFTFECFDLIRKKHSFVSPSIETWFCSWSSRCIWYLPCGFFNALIINFEISILWGFKSFKSMWSLIKHLAIAVLGIMFAFRRKLLWLKPWSIAAWPWLMTMTSWKQSREKPSKSAQNIFNFSSRKALKCVVAVPHCCGLKMPRSMKHFSIIFHLSHIFFLR